MRFTAQNILSIGQIKSICSLSANNNRLSYDKKQILTLPLLLPFSVNEQSNDVLRDKWDSLTSWYVPKLEKVNIAGSVVVFVKYGEIVAKKMYGFQDEDTCKPISLKVEKFSFFCALERNF